MEAEQEELEFSPTSPITAKTLSLRLKCSAVTERQLDAPHQLTQMSVLSRDTLPVDVATVAYQ